jgi:N-acetylmuramoyl-L-alanine amidase
MKRQAVSTVMSKKERGKSMSIIYSFLQKRKLHESQHGFIMVFAAFVLSALMLLLGSDVFYDINSTAAGIGVQTKEETQKLQNTGLSNPQTVDYPAQFTNSELIDPYGLTDIALVANGDETQSNDTVSGDTVWFLGDSMDESTFDSIVQQLGSTTQGKSKRKGNDDAAVKSLSVEKVVSTEYGNITDKEVKMLERIVQAEAGGEDMVGKILVANVILNRVADEHFPDSIKGVIFQHKNGDYQFSPVGNDRYWEVNISNETEKAVQRALSGEDYSDGALYFVARKKTDAHSIAWFDKKLDWLFKHGGHEFYKNK